MGAAPGITRSFRRVVITMAVAALAAAGLAGLAAAPAGADSAFGYTIEVNVPQGFGALSCRLAKVDLATGALTGIGSFLPHDDLPCAQDLAFSSTGVLYGISQFESGEEVPIEPHDFNSQAEVFNEEVHLVTFDTTTGAVTDLGRIGEGPAFIGNFDRPGGGITFDAAGNLWVMMVGQQDECDDAAFCLYAVDPANPGNATFTGAGLGKTYMFGLTASCTSVYTTAQVEPETDSQSDLAVALGGNTLF